MDPMPKSLSSYSTEYSMSPGPTPSTEKSPDLSDFGLCFASQSRNRLDSPGSNTISASFFARLITVAIFGLANGSIHIRAIAPECWQPILTTLNILPSFNSNVADRFAWSMKALLTASEDCICATFSGGGRIGQLATAVAATASAIIIMDFESQDGSRGR